MTPTNQLATATVTARAHARPRGRSWHLPTRHFQAILTRGNAGGVRNAELADEVSLGDLLQLGAKALGVEHQRARVAAQQVAPVRADLAEVVVVLRRAGQRMVGRSVASHRGTKPRTQARSVGVGGRGGENEAGEG